MMLFQKSEDLMSFKKFVLLTVFLFTSTLSGLWAEDFAYVTNNGADNVSVIDLSTNTVVDTVSVGAFPTGVAICTRLLELIVRAETGRDRFLTQTDLFNRISWIPPETPPTSYEILLNETTLLAILPGSATEFIDHNKRKGETNTYTVVAFDGTEEIARESVNITTE